MNDYSLPIVIGVVSLVAIWKIIKFLIILSNADNIPDFNLFGSWWRK